MLKRMILAAYVACLGAVTAAQSATLSIEPVTGAWSSSTPEVAGIGGNRLSWGRPPGAGRQSGYRFDGRSGFAAESGQAFSIGSFTHENFPIYGASLKQAALQVSFQIAGLTAPIVSTFSFLHNETPNRARVCANGVSNGQGVNVSGCADQVRLAMNDGLTQRFEIDGTSYALEILGFQRDGALVDTLWTEENQAKEALLMARFTVETPPTKPIPPAAEPPVSMVPLSGSGLFLATFLLGAGAIGASRRPAARKLQKG